jgi:hypothetical protein
MTRVATPENEATLLNIALHGTASHVERTVRQFRRLERIEAAAAAAESHRQQSVTYRSDNDDSVLIHARLPAEVGQLVRQAIELATGWVEAEASTAPDEPDYSFDSLGRRRAEGLRIMAEQFLARAAEDSGGSGDRYQVVVHVDQQVLSDLSDDSGHCEIEDGPALAIETVRRLGCDCSLIGIVEDAEGHPLNVGRKTRAIPHAIKRALKARDGGCRFPGCTHTRFTEGHHIEHWAEGGETKLENLITLCHFHHHLVHEGGYSVEAAPTSAEIGAFIFTRPNGTLLDEYKAVEKCFRGNILADLNGARGIAIDARIVDTRWRGESMDYSLAMDALIAARERCNADALAGPS